MFVYHKAYLIAQGVECQGLGSAAWNRIRYAEAEKRLRMGGMFQPLTMNPILEAKDNSDFPLRQQEGVLGTLCHGLIMQRMAFKESLTKVLDSCPGAKSAIKEHFYDNSEFQAASNALLQYVCGKRAEVISDRRKAVKPKEGHKSLHQIHPSLTHLFDEDLLTK